MSEKLHLEIYTPEGIIFNKDVDEIEGPGYEGAFGILPHHTPYFVILRTGVLTYRDGDKWSGFVIESGYAVVEENNVKVIVSSVEDIDSINYNEEVNLKNKISEEMKGLSVDSDEFISLENKFRKSIARIQAYERFVKK